MYQIRMHLYVARIITEEETMSSQDTVKKLRQMRLPVIAEQYEIQISDPSYHLKKDSMN